MKIRLSLAIYQGRKKIQQVETLVVYEIVTWKMNREIMTLEKETEGGDDFIMPGL